jgi:hypothetical protein
MKYANFIPNLCVKDTPVMRARRASIPCLCVNLYPAYAWKSANFHRGKLGMVYQCVFGSIAEDRVG